MDTSPVIDRPAPAPESGSPHSADPIDRIAATVQRAQRAPEHRGGWVIRTRRTSPLETRYATR